MLHRSRQWIAIWVMAATIAAMSAAAAAQTTAGPFAQKDGKPAGGAGVWDGTLRVVLALALVVGLIYLSRYLLRKAGGAGKLHAQGGVVETLWRTNLSMKHQLTLVRMGRRVLLLGCTPQEVSTLCEVTDPQEIAELLNAVEEGKGDSFTRLLSRKAGQFAGDVDQQGQGVSEMRKLADKLRSEIQKEDTKK